MNYVKAINNFFPSSFSDTIEELVMSDFFPWYFNGSLIYGEEKNDINPQEFQFTNTLYRENQQPSVYFDILKPMMYFFEDKFFIKIKKLVRMKCNLTTNVGSREFVLSNRLHQDIQDIEGKFLSFLYYVNDSDGDTIIQTTNADFTVSPKKNRLVCFDSRIPHYGQYPLLYKRRTVINTVVEIV